MQLFATKKIDVLGIGNINCILIFVTWGVTVLRPMFVGKLKVDEFCLNIWKFLSLVINGLWEYYLNFLKISQEIIFSY